MIGSSFLLIAATAGLHLVSAATAPKQDASPAITVQQKAIEPTCITEKIVTSSSCQIGLKTKRAEATGLPSSLNLNQKAIPAKCDYFYTTTTDCRIGVHPQPTDLTVTVTENSKAPDGSTVATTVTTAAQASIDVPKSTETGTMAFSLTPGLRSSIVKTINAACPKKLKARDDVELVDLACTLPESSYDNVFSEVQQLIGDGIAFDQKAAQALFGATVSAQEVRTTLTALLVTAALSQAAGNGKLALSSEMSASIYKPLLKNPPKGGDSKSSVSTSTSTGQPATGIEAPPYFGTIPVDSAYTAILTKYLVGKTTTASGPFCTHGAQPGVLKGEDEYCYCDGKYYPTSKSTYVSTISGTKTTLNELCPYTAAPKSTFTNFGNTIDPTRPASTGPTTTAPATTARPIPSKMCLPGQPGYKLDPVTKKVNDFCSSASKASWAANAEPTLTNINALNGMSTFHFLPQDHPCVLTILSFFSQSASRSRVTKTSSQIRRANTSICRSSSTRPTARQARTSLSTSISRARTGAQATS